MCAERLPLRGSLRVSPDRRRAELGAIPGPRTIGACSPVGLRCSAAFKARQVKISMFLPVVCVALRAEQRICAIRLLLCRLLLKSKSQDQKLPPSAGDFCYGKSHQNHVRRTATAARCPARLARQAPRRTRAIPGPRTIGACSPVGLRCSAAFKARKSKPVCLYRPMRCNNSYGTAELCHAGFDSVRCKDQELPPSAGDFCYGKSHQNHVRRTAAAARYPARLARQAPRRTRAIHGPRTIGACSPVGLRCSAAFKARKSKALCCCR